eukprot:363431-Chlamydomonas_euryale.AAC.3
MPFSQVTAVRAMCSAAATVRAAGGLLVVGTSIHESARVELQLAGRAGRQVWMCGGVGSMRDARKDRRTSIAAGQILLTACDAASTNLYHAVQGDPGQSVMLYDFMDPLIEVYGLAGVGWRVDKNMQDVYE